MKHKSKSYLPGDGMSPEMGDNYGLDGFDFDFDYGGGLEPKLDNYSILPDAHTFTADESTLFHDAPGFVETVEHEDYDLGDFLKDASTLVDHEWLDPTQLGDPNRLPKQKHNRIIQELEGLWGGEEAAAQEANFHRVPVVDKEAADYQASLEGSVYDTPVVEAREKRLALRAKVRHAVQRAMRRSTYGEPIADILREAAASLGKDAPLAQKALEVVKNEHGLAGNVFIRASAFPGLHNGKWADTLKKKASRARYIVAEQGSKVAAFERLLGKQVVASVPWKEAFAVYAPQLASVGYKVGSGDPKMALKRAFLTGPEVKEHQPTVKPVDLRPADMISPDEAKRQWKQADTVQFDIVTKEAVEEQRLRERVHKRLASWVKGGFLRSEDSLRLRSSAAKPMDVLRVAASLIVIQSPTVKYAGIGIGKGFTPAASREEAWEALRQAEAAQARVAEQLEKEQRSRMGRHLAKMLTSGLLTRQETNRLVRSTAKPQDVMQIAASLIMLRKEGQPRTLNLSSGKYAGEGVGAVVVQVASQEEAWEALREAESRRAQVQEDLAETSEQKVRQYIAKMAQRGFLTKKDVRRLHQSSADPKDILQMVHALVMHRTGSLPKTMEIKKVKYAGEGVGAVPWSDLSVDEAWEALRQAEARQSKVHPKEMARITRHARQKLSEGSAGKDFNFWLKATFSKELREASKGQIRALRAEHEGLSGHLYVDAEAYATPKGIEGCEKGALKHRANNIKFVMAMDRCSTCVFRNAEAVCSKYNKRLVDTPPVEDRKAYQREMIRLANASDAEATASLFAPTYTDDFGLEDNLDNISLNHSASSETLGEILFGGMEIDL